MSLEREIKSIALRWANTGGSHSDDLLEEILSALKSECIWEPRNIREESYDIDHVAILKSKDYKKEFYRATDEEWAAWLTEDRMTYNMRQWAAAFFVEDEMQKENDAL